MTSADRDLQEIVDDLGRRTSRSVAIDDRQLRLLAHSRHYGEVDAARLDSVLQRVASDEAIRDVRSQGIESADGPVRVRSTRLEGFLPRVCVPIRHRGLHLGYLWFIDADESMTADELALAAKVADEAGVSMYRRDLLHHRDRGREQELGRDLLAAESETRQRAAIELVEESLLVPGPVVVLVVSGPDLGDQDSRVALDGALIETRRRLPSRHSLHLLRHDHGVLVVAEHGDLRRPRAQAELGAQLRDNVTNGGLAAPRVGMGGSRPELGEALESYDEAVLAVQAAQHVAAFDAVARWDDLGVYRTLVQLPASAVARALDPGFTALLDADTDGTLVKTLETYLDLACSSQRTADVLAVHRTSVYYRLTRIQDLSGLDLESGDHRLALHLSVKLARLTGLLGGR